MYIIMYMCMCVCLQFLTKNPTRRLGCQPGIGERQIKGHAFFRSLDWEKLEQRSIPAPFRPQVVRVLMITVVVSEMSAVVS